MKKGLWFFLPAAAVGAGIYWFTAARTYDWPAAQKTIAKNCREQTLEFIQSPDGFAYLRNLSSGLPEEKYLSWREVPQNSAFCWVVWRGKEDGQGQAAYEAADGRVRKLQVKNFPVFAPSILDPVSPTRP
jgi:hypothetical protein